MRALLLFVILGALQQALSFSPRARVGLSSPLRQQTVQLQMGFLDGLMKMFSGGEEDTSVATSSTPSNAAWVDPEPGRFPPKITIPPEPKRKLTLKDLKPAQLKGKRCVYCLQTICFFS